MSITFNGAELKLARVFNEMTLEEVAERVGKTRQYLHKLEAGLSTPTDELMVALANILQIEPDFLVRPPMSAIPEEQFHFRKQFTTRAMTKQVTLARGELICRLVCYLEKELKLPELRIPEVSDAYTVDDIERAAEKCRLEWGLGNGPIANMSRLAENVGAVITSFSSVSKEIDALSVATSRPVIVRNDAKESVCRQRFDVAHELGHLVLHNGRATGDRRTESEANRYAGALILPRAMMAKLFPRPKGSRLDWTGIKEFKLTWKMSKAAILYRAKQLDLISDAQYKSGVITLRRTGEALSEREDHMVAAEAPELLERSMQVLADKKEIFGEDVARTLGLKFSFLSNLLGFAPPSRERDSASRPSRPHLYLVV